MIGVRLSLVALLLWVPPAAAVCEVLCTPEHARRHARVAEETHVRHAAADHCEREDDSAHTASHSSTGDECCCVSPQVTAKGVELRDLVPKSVRLSLIASTSVLLLDGTPIFAGSPGGLPSAIVLAHVQRSLPLLL